MYKRRVGLDAPPSFEVPRRQSDSPNDRHRKPRKCQGPYPWPKKKPALIFRGHTEDTLFHHRRFLQFPKTLDNHHWVFALLTMAAYIHYKKYGRFVHLWYNLPLCFTTGKAQGSGRKFKMPCQTHLTYCHICSHPGAFTLPTKLPQKFSSAPGVYIFKRNVCCLFFVFHFFSDNRQVSWSKINKFSQCFPIKMYTIFYVLFCHGNCWVSKEGMRWSISQN
jgi:hypothetical protein